MNRDGVAFADEHNRAEAVRASRVRVLNYAAAIWHDLAHGIADAVIRVQIQQHAAASDFLFVGHEAAAVAALMLHDAEREIAVRLLIDTDAKYGPVKSGRTIEVGHRNVEPNGAVVLTVEVAHDECTRLKRLKNYSRE